jgi:hypothetical protein
VAVELQRKSVDMQHVTLGNVLDNIYGDTDSQYAVAEGSDGAGRFPRGMIALAQPHLRSKYVTCFIFRL